MKDEKRYIQAQFEDSGRVELVHIQDGKVASGVFDDVGLFRLEASRCLDSGNLFHGLNPTSREAGNVLRMGCRVADDDITLVRRIPFDMDPERPANMSSADEELADALHVRDDVAGFLAKQGWPDPVHAISGNGGHLVYRTNLSASKDCRQKLDIIYTGLSSLLSTKRVKVDATVRNPSRIFRLYGTTNRKGDSTQDRPHRQSMVDYMPAGWQAVTAEQVVLTEKFFSRYLGAKRQREKLAHPTRKPIPTGPKVQGSADYRSLDVVAWFQSHGHYLRPLRDWKGSPMHAVRCPWFEEHSTESPRNGSDTVVFEATEGWPGFYCAHSHCEGRHMTAVMSIWGDADAFCTEQWKASA